MPGHLIPEAKRRATPRTAALPIVALFCLAVAGWLVWHLTDAPGSLAAPAQTATPTLIPGAGGIAGGAWDDGNGNGQREGDEPPLPGLTVTLANAAGQPIASALSGADGGYRFDNLAPGLYRLTGAPPAGYRLTTQAEFNALVSAGVVVQLDFGAKFVPTATPTPTPAPQLDIDHAPLAVCGGIVYGDTRLGTPNVSRYACKPHWDESGPELVYQINLSRHQLFTASLVTTTADLDLFLLPSAFPETCLAVGDNFLSYDAPSRIYFLAVDGYAGATGSFALRIECPLEPQATATPTPTSSPTPVPTITPTPSRTPTITPTAPPRLLHLPLIVRLAPLPTPEPVTVTFQQDQAGYTGATDTYLNQWEATSVFGAGLELVLRLHRQAIFKTPMAPLLRFDLAPLPPGANVVSATLSLYLVSTPVPYDIRGETHGLLRAWNEAAATWDQPAAGQAWAQPGAQGVGADYIGWATDDQPIDLAVNRWYTFNVTELVQMWTVNANANYGVILLTTAGVSDSNQAATFASREHTDQTVRPRLSVSYWLAGSGQ